jgi:hypothetical protein
VCVIRAILTFVESGCVGFEVVVVLAGLELVLFNHALGKLLLETLDLLRVFFFDFPFFVRVFFGASEFLSQLGSLTNVLVFEFLNFVQRCVVFPVVRGSCLVVLGGKRVGVVQLSDKVLLISLQM